MKSQKGITLVSVTVYVIVIALVIGVIATVTSFFYSNTKYIDESGQDAAQFDTFNMFFLEDVRKEGNSIVGLKVTDGKKTVFTKKIKFSDGTSYTIEGDGIYRNQVKICSNAENSDFKCEVKDGKIVVTALLTFGDTFSKQVQYLAEGKIEGYHSYEIANAKNINAPELTSNMTPVIWNGSAWIATDKTDEKWFDYTKGKNLWANVAIGNYAKGTNLGDGTDLNLYVWIPRFEYDPVDISIRFVQGKTESSKVHPAFSRVYIPETCTARKVEVSGIWISKYRANEEGLSVKPNQKLLQISMLDYYGWSMQKILQNTEANSFVGTLIKENKGLEMQNNTTYGAVCFLSLCALDGNMPEETVGGQDSKNTNLSTTNNPTGVYSMNCEEGQLVAALYSTYDYPVQDNTIRTYVKINNQQVLMPFPITSYCLGNTDNASEGRSVTSKNRFLGTAIPLNSDWPKIESNSQVYFRGGQGSMLNAQAKASSETGTFHFVIADKWFSL